MLKTAPKITKFIDEFFCVEWSVLWVYISLTGIELSEHVLFSEEKKAGCAKCGFSQYQASLAVLERPGDGDCDLMRSQSGGWPCLCSVAICQ